MINMDNLFPFIIASAAFALYVTCPRMTAMIDTQSRVSGINPILVIALGCVLGIPLFAVLLYVLQHWGVGTAVLLAAALDVGAMLLMGHVNLRAGIELGVITIFVYAGIRIAPLIAKLFAPS